MAVWRSRVAEWSEEQNSVFMYVRETVEPYFSDVLAYRSLGQRFAPFPDGESPPPVLPSEFDADAVRIVAESASFENVTYQRAQGLWYAMRDGETLRARLRDIQSLLEDNLNSKE